MNIIDAIKEMNEDKEIYRTCWSCKQKLKASEDFKILADVATNTVYAFSVTDLLADDWAIYEKPKEYFDFFEAIKRIKEGKRVTCKHNSNFYYYYDEDLNKPLRMIKASNLNNSQAVFCDFETNSKEWYEVD